MSADIIQFVTRARANLRSILDQSGKVLYSSVDTLCPGKIYFLGIQPGGTPGLSGTTIRENLELIPKKQTNDYLDEQWHDNVLQNHVINFLTGIGLGVRDVCASNVVFIRRKAQPSEKEYMTQANICWPVHLDIISIVRPSAIIAFGDYPYKFIRSCLGTSKEDFAPSGHAHRYGTLFCQSFQTEVNGYKTSVVGIPHLRRFPAGKIVVDFVKQCI